MNKRFLLLALVLAVLLWAPAVVRSVGGAGELVPIGASYQPDTLRAFSERAIVFDGDDVIRIKVLPITYASNPFSISASERADNLALAQSRAAEIEDACDDVVSQGVLCDAAVVDIQVRGDAQNAGLVAQLAGGDVDGVFILGGDQTIAMQVTANTLLEDALESLAGAGVPLGGTSAGAAVQSRYMIGGYTGNNFAWDALKLGAVDLWYGGLAGDQRGLRFGFQDAVIEQHVLERGRLPRLLQAVEQLPTGDLGLGVDWGTGVRIEPGEQITGTFGAYAAIVVDAGVFGAADSAGYLGPDQVLSIHRVALHILPPGGYGFDLAGRQPVFNGVIQTAPDPALLPPLLATAPAGYGDLYLGGDLSGSPGGAVMQAFAASASAAGGTTVVFAAGYSNDNAANQAATFWKGRLMMLGLGDVDSYALTNGSDLDEIASALNAAGAIFMVGGRGDALAAQIDALNTAGIRQALVDKWASGGPVLLDHAVAGAAGENMTAAGPPADVEIEASDSFLAGHVPIAPGLGFFGGAVFEPRVLYDYLYGRLVSLLAADPAAVAFGIARGTAIRISPGAVEVLGESAVIVMDGRGMTHMGVGDNGAFSAAWILLDTFAPGETLPQGDGEPTPTATPSPSSTDTPTPSPTGTPSPTATVTPGPSATTPGPSPTGTSTSTVTPVPNVWIYLPVILMGE